MPHTLQISLPEHVRPDHVHAVLSRLLGNEAIMAVIERENAGLPDFEATLAQLPAHEKKGFIEERLRVSKVTSFGGLNAKGTDTPDSFYHLVVKDATGTVHYWQYHETEPEDAPLREISPPTDVLTLNGFIDALAVAAGRRLVSFFGGEFLITGTDAAGRTGVYEVFGVPGKKALFPGPATDGSGTPLAPWPAPAWTPDFLDAFSRMPVLCASEIEEAVVGDFVRLEGHTEVFCQQLFARELETSLASAPSPAARFRL
jgi:hypothetical protein